MSLADVDIAIAEVGAICEAITSSANISTSLSQATWDQPFAGDCDKPVKKKI